MSYAIEIMGLEKKYVVVHEKGYFPLLKKTYKRRIDALDNITLRIKKGECFGIIGPNGSGKTTLLKILGGIIRPNSGNVKINGKLLSFLDLGSGIQEDLTGLENIYLYGKIIGMKKKEIDDSLNHIIRLAGLEDFIDVKFKKYSNGMKVRLIFSIAMASDPDIILIDEVLAVGDTDFQKKSFNRIKMMKEAGKTVVIVSHDISAVRKLCDRTLYLKKGVPVFIGDTDIAIGRYFNASDKDALEKALRDIEDDLKRLHEIKDLKAQIEDDGIKRRTKSILEVLSSRNIEKEKKMLLSEETKVKSDIIDTIDNSLIKAEEFINSFWERHSDGVISEEERKNLKESISLFDRIIKKLGLIDDSPEVNERYFNCLQALEDILLIINESMEDNKISIKNKLGLHKARMTKEMKKSRITFAEKEYRQFLEDLDLSYFSLREVEKIFDEYKEMLIKRDMYESIQEDKVVRLFKRQMIGLEKKDEELRYDLEKARFKGKKEEINIRLHNISEIKKDLVKLVFKEKFEENNKKLEVQSNPDVTIEKIVFSDKKGKEKNIFSTGETLNVNILYIVKNGLRIENPVFGIAIRSETGILITGPNTKFHGIKIPFIQGRGTMTYTLEDLPLLAGTYYVTVSIHPYEDFTPYSQVENKYSFKVEQKKIKDFGMIYFKSKWEIR